MAYGASFSNSKFASWRIFFLIIGIMTSTHIYYQFPPPDFVLTNLFLVLIGFVVFMVLA